ncbi:MAG: topoisomerase DNA-binding C4 zinc finger domain-containing protein [Alphaproteobacteria bacterium]|nr:topoisomerase DNA-binding C4 zinc finger domain-containing protein [Alphaproteobacteria bacterium]
MAEQQNRFQGIEFIKELAKYFMDFLETDFKKQKWPKRSIKTINSDNLRVGISLYKYPSFSSAVHKAFRKNFVDSLTLPPNTYKTSVPKKTLSIAKELTNFTITKKKMEYVAEVIKQSILKITKQTNGDFGEIIAKITPAISTVIKKEIVVPLISSLDTQIIKLSSNDVETTYALEEELTDVLCDLLKSKTEEIVKNFIFEKKTNISEELLSILKETEVQKTIYSFFENFQIGDLFSEVEELKRNNKVLDKQEFYLYFGEIVYQKEKFPIFYIPIYFNQKNTIEFGTQLFINKRALHFITQEYNKATGKMGNIEDIQERIIYLTKDIELEKVTNKILNSLIIFFSLDKKIDLADSQKQISKGFFCQINTNMYIALFDRSDEALVNDYEEILDLLAKEDPILVNSFYTLINDFIHKEPESFIKNIKSDWKELPTEDKLIYKSPIPLNREQRQILSAINKEKCKYIVVEGPPGTGKSHTITAMVCDAILKNESILVLSDKKEALDVVEDKITGAINKIRNDKNFQNPILRLGKAGSTYNQILSSQSIDKIRNFHSVLDNKIKQIERDIEKITTSLKKDIQKEISLYDAIKLKNIDDFVCLENIIKMEKLPFDIHCFLSQDAVDDLIKIKSLFSSIKNKLNPEQPLLQMLGFKLEDLKNFSDLETYIAGLNNLLQVKEKVTNIYREQLSVIQLFSSLQEEDIDKIKKHINIYIQNKTPVFGFLFKGKFVAQQNLEFRKTFNINGSIEPHKKLEELSLLSDIMTFAVQEFSSKFSKKVYFDKVKTLHIFLQNKILIDQIQGLLSIEKYFSALSVLINKYPFLRDFDPLKEPLSFVLSNFFTNYSEENFSKLIDYLKQRIALSQTFETLPESSFLAQKELLEQDVTYKMAYQIDDQLISFYDENRNTAKTLKEIIKAKQKFPRNIFSKLKEAFPCILAGIRDYAEYIPLLPNIFDLIIIDEASQVSIAQAFPALLRAKKVVVLGDRKQFSNVKTNQAKTEVNLQYVNQLRSSFVNHISRDPEKRTKLDKFNIKTSILDFFDFIANYSTQLQKHFRGYKELISYSNTNFYNKSLQVMKIRGKMIDDVLKFSFITSSAEQDKPNTNKEEAEFILEQLNKMKEEGQKASVGIITPHTNQQKLLLQLVSDSINKDFFESDLHLKIMTFDTCQGEERDIIFYSMVASEHSDRLSGVFIKDLKSVDIEADGQLRAQRLNVGFSRAKEQIHFVLSKPISEYNGAIGEALRHFYATWQNSKKEALPNETDPQSAMEKKILHYFYQTDFYNENKENIEFRPQFKLGEYLSQIDSTYQNPNYRVDFLLLYKENDIETHKIIIEYDGFDFHFQQSQNIDSNNYENYYTEQDIYRQKILESYGYKFLRINRFNLGEEPIKTLNSRLKNLLQEYTIPAEEDMSSVIKNTVNGVASGQMKECPKCKQIRPISDFYDSNLVSKYGRICKYCKNTNLGCPKCGASMVIREGTYGKFYGCSHYPSCRGTRPFYG